MQQEICLTHASHRWIGLIIMAIFGAILVFSIEMLREWWHFILPGYLVVIVLWFSRVPMRHVFDPRRQILALEYPLGSLLHKKEEIAFSAIAAIQSFPRGSGDSDPVVVLELVMCDGRKETLERLAPEWADHGPLLGLARCREPGKMAALREQIAALTGIQDRGYLGSRD